MHLKTYFRNSWQDGTFLFVSLMYSLLLLRWGYVMGSGDHVEILPYALLLNDPSLYPNDLFLQSIVQIVPNERWMIAQLLAMWGKQIEAGVFIYHFISSFILLLGMDRVLRHLIHNKYLAWIAIFLILIPFYLWNPGANELYYNTFTAASLAKGLGIWAIYSWLTKRIYPAAILLIFSTLIHPLVGLQLAMLIFGVEFIVNRKQLFAKKNTFLLPFLLYMLTGFLYVVVIKLNYDATASTQSSLAFFQQIFVFRNGHHYIPSQYPLKSWLMAAFCWGFAFWRFKDQRIRILLGLMLLGGMIYTLGVEVFQSPTAAAFQWFKVSIWLKVLGIGAMMGGVNSPRFADGFAAPLFGREGLNAKIKFLFTKARTLGKRGGLGVSLLLTSWMLLFGTQHLPYDVPFDFGNQKQSNSLIAISQEIKAKTPQDALFIHPMEVSAFSYYAERAVYVSYKANLKQNAGAKIWQERVEEIYGLSFLQTYSDKQEAARETFLALGEKDLIALRKKGITHILTYKEHLLPENWLLIQNQDWAVYEIPEEKFTK